MGEVKQCEGPSDPHCSLKQYVPVPVTGTYMVFPGGRVREVAEAGWIGSDNNTSVRRDVYTVVLVDDDE